LSFLPLVALRGPAHHDGMRLRNPAAVSLFWLLTLTGCAEAPSGPGVYFEERPLQGFSTIQLDVPADLVVRLGPTWWVSIAGSERAVPAVTTEVRNGTLFIGASGASRRLSAPLSVEVTVPYLTSVRQNAGGTLDLESPPCWASRADHGTNASD
jgi:hypothetical protein